MSKVELHCLMVERAFGDYPSLAKMLRKQDVHVNFKQTSRNSSALKHALKQLQGGASLVFVPEELFRPGASHNTDPHVKDTLQVFADLIWQYASDAIVVVLGNKPPNKPFAYNMNDVQISHLHFVNDSEESQLRLQFLVQTALLKFDFRRCKRLLGVSEKRSQRLLDSSVVPIANISRDLHLYANTSYLSLLGVDSLHALRSLPVKDFILKEEHKAFDSFIKTQLRQPKESQTLFLQMQTKDGSSFRSNIRVIPSVFKGRRCLQLWVNALQKQTEPVSEIAELWNENKANTLSGFTDGPLKRPVNNFHDARQTSVAIDPALVLKKIISKKEAQIFTQELLALNNTGLTIKNTRHHYIVSLKIPYAQRRAVDDLLTEVSQEEIKTLRSLFWDKVKLTRLFQVISKKKVQDARLMVRLSEATIKNKKQIAWLQKNLKRTGSKSSMMVFMLPSRLDEAGQKACVEFILKLKPYGCQFALDEFFVNAQSLILLKHAKPQLLRLYLPWLQGIEGNEKREIALGRFIRQIESRNIRIIVPCGFSQDMKKLFIHAGASFCQERISKRA